MVTKKQAFDLMFKEFERPSEKLDDFELWLLHRAHRPDEFPDAAACADAWHLVKTYRASLRG